MNKYKVSVCMISYNQARYISQAIEGVLLQKTSFHVELVISDDCSTDETKAIIDSYKAKFPEKIRVVEREKNLGMMPNFIDSLKLCDGEFVAICEGDDYWIDAEKLQMQVDFLDANPNYSICFHKVYELDGDKTNVVSNNPWSEEKSFSIDDLSKNNFINALSIVFRNGLIDDYPVWFKNSPIGDYVLSLFVARNGLIKYMAKPMGVYRLYTGVWSTKPAEMQIEKMIDVLKLLEAEDFPSVAIQNFREQRLNYIKVYCQILLNKNDFSFLKKLKEEDDDSLFRSLIFDIYPKKIEQLLNSKQYKLINKIHRWKKFLF